ncbi:MAG: DUF4397 domain-containing protein [Bacteroidota bacterium]
MKRSFTLHRFKLSFATMLLLVAVSSYAQQARLQLIHNAAGVALDTVDVYINDTKFEDVAFRTATSLQTLAAGTYALNINSRSSSDSGDQVLVRFTITLAANSGNVILVTGVEDTTLYAANPEGRNRSVRIIHRRGVVFGSSNIANVATTLVHGATDAPSVNIVSRGSTALNLTNVRYGDTTGNLFIPAQQLFTDIRLNSSGALFKSYLLPLNGRGGRSLVVFASGFVTPANNQNGTGFGLYAVDTNGGTCVAISEGARLQVVHAAVDTAIKNVDVWAGSTKIISNLAPLKATTTLSLLAGSYKITITRAGAADENTDVLYSIPATEIEGGKNYIAVAAGVTDTSVYKTNPTGVERSFRVYGTDSYTETGVAGNVRLWYFNGVADADSTQLSRGINLFSNQPYGEFGGPSDVPTTASTAYVLRETFGGQINRTFRLRLPTSLNNRVGLLFSAGYADTAANPAKVLSSYYIAFTDGSVQSLSELNAFVQIIHASADPNLDTVDIYINGTKALDNFVYTQATPFLPIVPYKAAEVKIAPGNSTSVSDAIATKTIIADSSRYHYAVATGLLNPSAFAANPNGVNTSFDIVVNNQATLFANLSPKNVDLMYFHSATDVTTTTGRGFSQVQFLSKDDNYKSFHGYRSQAAFDDILYELKDAVLDTLLYFGYADLVEHQGKTGLAFAAGFRNPAANQNGSQLKLFIAWPEGRVDTVGPKTPGTFVSDAAAMERSLRVYPNPANTQTTVVFESQAAGDATLRMFDITGKEMLLLNTTTHAGKNTIALPLDSAKAGIYLVRIEMDGNTYTRKFNVVK